MEVRKVKTGAADGAHTVIESGLKAGESVVIDGVDRLKDGAEVRLAGAKPPAASGGGGDAPREHKHRRNKGDAAP